MAQGGTLELLQTVALCVPAYSSNGLEKCVGCIPYSVCLGRAVSPAIGCREEFAVKEVQSQGLTTRSLMRQPFALSWHTTRRDPWNFNICRSSHVLNLLKPEVSNRQGLNSPPHLSYPCGTCPCIWLNSCVSLQTKVKANFWDCGCQVLGGAKCNS